MGNVVVNLCDVCINKGNFPLCMPQELEFGEGLGNDNIVKCARHEKHYSNIEIITHEEHKKRHIPGSEVSNKLGISILAGDGDRFKAKKQQILKNI